MNKKQVGSFIVFALFAAGCSVGLINPKLSNGISLRDYCRPSSVLGRMDQNGAINFYGRITDQNGKSVEGVEVLVDHRSFMAFSSQGKGSSSAVHDLRSFRVVSDRNGCFSVTGLSGSSLEFVLDKSGYKLAEDQQQGFLFSSVLGPGHRSQSNNPTVFHMWRTGDPQPLIHRKQRNIDLGVESGLELWINLVSGGVSTNRTEDADLKFELELPGQEAGNRAGIWIFRLVSLNGGVQEAIAPTLFEAPESGYLKELSYDSRQQEVESWYRSMRPRRYFLRLRNGALSGALKLSWVVGNYGQGRIDYELWMNPEGGTNLEPDPGALITNPTELARIDAETRSD